MLGVILGAIVLVCGGCVALAAIGANVADDTSIGELVDEVAIDFSGGVPANDQASCEVTGIQDDGSDDYAVDAIITNTSGIRSHYYVDYELVGPDGQLIGSDFGIVSEVTAGATVRDFTLGVVDGDVPWQDVSCVVTGATRVDA